MKMRARYIVCGALIACSGAKFESVSGRQYGISGRAGWTGTSASAGWSSAGTPEASGSGGSGALGAGGSSPRAGAGGSSDPPTNGDAGEPASAGMGGLGESGGSPDAPMGSVGGRSPSGGRSSGHAGSGGRGGSDGDGCRCDAAHDCVEGVCVIRTECDCDALGVECSPLKSALGKQFACPIDVQCGTCAAGELCMITGGSTIRRCVTPTANVSCSSKEETDPDYYSSIGVPPSCDQAGYPPECSTPYAFCGLLVLPDTGAACPGVNAWNCGPAL